MSHQMPFLLLFVIIPIAEVYAFLAVGDEIGIFQTLLLCVLTAIIGGILVKQQGLATAINTRIYYRYCRIFAIIPSISSIFT